MKESKRQFLLAKILNVIIILIFFFGYIVIVSATVPGSQAVTVSGQVFDVNKGPIPGVNVIEKGTTNGVITDANGKFTISVSKKDAMLQFTFIGYVNQEVAVKGKTFLTITLLEDVLQLEEVMVVGYGTQKKMTVTGAISSVKSDDLIKSPQASVANTLAGRVTGLTSVQYSGQPGADDPNIYVRGIGSLTAAASTPLVLVDGVERSFTQLDPNEIESITVLKDASATSVYGIKGANGVIIITTRRGTESAPKISFSLSSGLQVPTRLPEFADSYTWAKMYNEALKNDNPAAAQFFSNAVLEKYRTQSDPLIYPSMNLFDYALKPSSLQTQQNINISGGTKDVKYFLSIGHLFQDGLLKNFGQSYNSNYAYNRYNYRANVDINITKTTKLGLTIGGRTENRNKPNEQVAESPFRYFFASPPFSSAGIIDGKRIVTAGKYHNISGIAAEGLATLFGRGYINDNKNVLNLDVNINQQLDFITKGLEFRTKVAYNSDYNHNKVRSSSSAYYEAWYKADSDASAPGDSTVVLRKFGTDGILGYSESFGKDRDWYMEGGFAYNRSFNDHNLTGLLLYNQSKNYYPGVYPGIPVGTVGLVGRATYDFKRKYLLELNIGYNGSENFSPDRRFGFFPSFSGGWVISEEKFMKSISFLSYMKIRTSFGIVGNDQQGSNRFLYLPDSYSANAGGYNFGTDNPQNQIIAAELKVGNPIVTWEKAKKQNYGIDVKMFKERLSLNFDYFYEFRDNILTTRNSVPNIIAMTLPAVNIGKVENHGYEIELNWRGKFGSLNYSIKPNMSFSRNKVLFKDEVPKPFDYLSETGQRVGQPFVYITDGFWTAEDLTHIKDFPDHLIVPIPGAWRFKDLNNDKIINTYDRRPNGYPDYPEYVLGTTIGLNYKGFDFSMLWTGVTNVSRQLFVNSQFLNPFGPGNSGSLMQYMVDDRWTPQTAATATYPSFSIRLNDTNGSNLRESDWSQKDGSYLRLKNAELGYTFDKRTLKRLHISALRIYVNGYNLLTFDKIKIYDPEAKMSDLNPFYPLMQIYNMGINVTF
jgi:TonB-linked SusC/RagA family outer membrane protein